MTTLAASLSGALLASGDSAGSLSAWGLAYGALLGSVRGAHTGGITALCFLGDDLVSGACSACWFLWQ